MRSIARQALGYGVASGIALAVDISILWILVRFLSFNYLLAASIAFVAGGAVAYALSVRFVFEEHRLRDRRAEFLSFLGLGTVGLGVNASVMALAVAFLGWHYIIAKCVAAAFTFTCNFLLRRQLLFIRRSPS